MSIPWIMITILILLILFGIIAIVLAKKNKGKKEKRNYYAIFMIGAIWVPFGLFMMLMYPETTIGSIFFILGWIYFIQGIIHKDEWDKKRGPYLIENKTWRWSIIIGLLALILAGIVAYLVTKGSI